MKLRKIIFERCTYVFEGLVMKRRKDYIEFRRYDLSGSEPVLVMNVDTWEKCYPDGTRILHFHNLMEVGYCHEGDGSLIIDNKEYPFGNDMISIIPANMTHSSTRSG